MGLFSKFKKNKNNNKSSMDNALNDFFRLKDTSYTTPPKPNFSHNSSNNSKEVSDYLNEKLSSKNLTTRDLFAYDALNNQAYTRLAQALQKELGCGDIKPDGNCNFEWNTLVNYVMTTVTIRNYYEKTVRVTLGINCRSNNSTNAITLLVGDDKVNIPLDTIPDMESDASFIYENTAKKVKDYLVSKRYNSITF